MAKSKPLDVTRDAWSVYTATREQRRPAGKDVGFNKHQIVFYGQLLDKLRSMPIGVVVLFDPRRRRMGFRFVNTKERFSMKLSAPRPPYGNRKVPCERHPIGGPDGTVYEEGAILAIDSILSPG